MLIVNDSSSELKVLSEWLTFLKTPITKYLFSFSISFLRKLINVPSAFLSELISF